MSTRQPESKIVADILSELKRPGWRFRKVHGDAYSSGEPDLDGCANGRAVKIEVKVPGKKPTAQQMVVMKLWARSGALVGWVTSVDETLELLSHLDDPGWVNPQLS